MQGRKIIFVSIHVQLEKNGHRTLFYVFLALFGGREIMVTRIRSPQENQRQVSVIKCLLSKEGFIFVQWAIAP